MSCKDDSAAVPHAVRDLGLPCQVPPGHAGSLLSALPELQAGLKVHVILASLLDRLARWVIRTV